MLNRSEPLRTDRGFQLGDFIVSKHVLIPLFIGVGMENGI